MKLNQSLKDRKVRRAEWAPDEWLKIAHVGADFAVAVDQNGKEVVLPYDKKDEDWILLNPHIPLTKAQKPPEDQE